jgi:cytochrome-b5 reductase
MDRVTRIKTTMSSLFPVMDILVEAHETKPFQFALFADATLGMFPGDSFYIHARIDGESVKGSYRLSSRLGATGFFDHSIERYETGIISKPSCDSGLITQC